jgi:cytoskeleton protein RodZ
MAGIGETLREARMRLRIDISEVEAHTKIRAKYLRAIENEDFDLLPGPVFVKSFLKTYGDYLGIDSRLLIDEFKRRYESPSDHEARSISTRTRERERSERRRHRPLVPPALAIIAVLVIVVGALYLLGRGTVNNKTGQIGPKVAGTGQEHHHGSNSGSHAGQGGHHNHSNSGTPPAKKPPPVPKTATLALANITSPVWVCVENASGRKLIPGIIYNPGDTIRKVQARKLLVNLGNSGVEITANGKPYTPSTTSAIGLTITPTAVKALSPAPTCG